MFTKAIVRKPGLNFAMGITTSSLGKPDYLEALRQHTAYSKALKACGLALTVLKPDPQYPDAPFVEDTVVIAGKTAIITCLGDIRRQGEEKKIEKELASLFTIRKIKFPGTVDGGDVLKIEDHYYIGLSRRTNRDGANELAGYLSRAGYSSSFVEVKNILHLKSGINYIGNYTILALKGLEILEEFKNYNIIEVEESESYAANCLLINNNLLVPSGFPETMKKLTELPHGYQLIELKMTEFEKMDGGLTCLSILF